MATPMRIALVGAGLAANSHGLDIMTDDRMELVGVVGTSSPSAAALTELFGGVVYPDLDAMLGDPQVDGVVVAVPPRAVPGILERLIDSGTPCLFEKPIATNSDGLGLLKRSLERETPLVAPFNRRYQPHIVNASHEVTAGAIGEVARVTAVWYGPYRSRFEPGAGTYRGYAGPREGVLVDNGAHALDAIMLMLGGIDGPRLGTVSLRHNERGAEVEADVSLACGPVEVSLRMIDSPEDPGCDRCAWQVRVEGTGGALTVNDAGCAVELPHGEVVRHLVPQEMTRPVCDLPRLRDGEEPLGTGIEDLLALSELLTRMYDSGGDGRSQWLRPRGKALGRLNGSC